VARSDAEAVLITGVFGTGKSSLAAELAYELQQRGAPYAAIDLDWLLWFDTGLDPAAVAEVYWRNVRAELDGLADAVGVPMRVVRLEVPLDEIERRLTADAITERRDDLRRAGEWLDAAAGADLADLTLPNVGPISELAATVLDWLGWNLPRTERVTRA
jgi:hypothetical protein